MVVSKGVERMNREEELKYRDQFISFTTTMDSLTHLNINDIINYEHIF